MSLTTPPQTDRPRTIALLGWAALSKQAEEGSGYNLNASELAVGLAQAGHRVHYLGSGLRYGLRPGPFIREIKPWRGIRNFELFNSPNLAPSAINLRNVGAERSCPSTTRLVLRWLRDIGAHVVHAHSTEGLSLDLFAAIESAGIPVVATTHNYSYLCPQVDLLYNEHEVCLDYQGGTRCAHCLDAPNPTNRRLKRRLGQAAQRLVGPAIAGHARASAKAITSRRTPETTPADELRYLGYDNGAIESATDAEGPASTYGVRAEPRELPKPAPILPSDTNERMLANTDVHLKVLNDYGRRRHDGIAALNAASLVTPPSDFLGRVHESMGLNPAKRRTVRLGQPHFDRMHRAAIALPGYDRSPWTPADPRPLRLAFFGTVRPNKGLRVLADAIAILPADIRQRCLFHVRAAGGDWAFRKLLSGYSQVQFAGAYDLMQRAASVAEYDVGLLPHIWMENSPLVLLEHLHAGKLVITSRLGGPPEWIVDHDGVTNGLLFPSGDAQSLADRISSLVRGDVTLPSARTIHDITPHLTSYPAHLAQVQSIYEEVIKAKASRPVDKALEPA
jgi:glycosyltransferase involved in cell wall biosynthesis